MRKRLIAQCAAAVIAGLGMVGAAHAIGTPGGATADQLVVNTDGTGHINIVPYFSTQAGTATNINIVNSDTVNGKAVKVRFRSAANSDDIFDFTLLMSPGDVFAFAVSRVGSDAPKVSTGDTTCTLPNNISGRSFVLDRLPDVAAADRVNLASEGYVEILTMADIKPTDPIFVTATNTTGANPLYTTIKHTASKPKDCTTASAAIAGLLTDPADLAAANAKGLFPASTGLFTNWTLINVEKASAWSGTATAVEARDSDGAALGHVVFFPQRDIAVLNPALYTADPVLAGGVDSDGDPVPAAVAAAQYDFPDLSTPYTTAPANPAAQAFDLSLALTVQSVTNEFLTDDTLLARTDWVFSSPTRRYSVAVAYEADAGDDLVVYNEDLVDLFYGPANVKFDGGQICVKGIVPTVLGDREENFAKETGDFVISPGTPADPKALCGEVSVLTFRGKASVLGASVADFDLSSDYTKGWATLSTPGAVDGIGLPVIGFAAMEVVNGNVGGNVANYGMTFPHRVVRGVAP